MMLASRERGETSVALTSTLHWFETDVLTEEGNYQGLARLNTALTQHAAARSATRRVTLDIDSSESPVHGTQEQSAYNGHFESVCYHPLFVFNPEGDCLAATLRPGNVHSADGWDDVLLPIIDRYGAQGQTVVVRADAAFALPALYEALERRGVRYAIRLPANDVLERRIEELLTRPRGRPSHAPLVRYRSFEYQAASWSRPRRVIAKVEHHFGELFPRVGFIVTTLTGTNRAVVRFQPLGVVGVRVTGQTAVDRLTEEVRQRELPILPGTGIGEMTVDQHAQAKSLVQLAWEQQPRIGGHRGPVKLDAELRVE